MIKWLSMEVRMRRLMLLAVSVFFGVLVVAGQASAAKVNSAAPDFSLKDLDGRTVSLKDLKG